MHNFPDVYGCVAVPSDYRPSSDPWCVVGSGISTCPHDAAVEAVEDALRRGSRPSILVVAEPQAGKFAESYGGLDVVAVPNVWEYLTKPRQ